MSDDTTERTLQQALCGTIANIRECEGGAKLFELLRDDQKGLECRVSPTLLPNSWLFPECDVVIVGTTLPPPFEVSFGKRLNDDARPDDLQRVVEYSPWVESSLATYERARARDDHNEVTRIVWDLVQQASFYEDDLQALLLIVIRHRREGGCAIDALDALETHIGKHFIRNQRAWHSEPRISDSNH